MASYRPKCEEKECFQNVDGVHCELLVKSCGQPCPFFKTSLVVDVERNEAYRRLKEIGRDDLIQKYICNPEREGIW